MDAWVSVSIAHWKVEDFELLIDPCTPLNTLIYDYDFRALDGCPGMQLKRLIMSHGSTYRAYKSQAFLNLTKLSLGKLQFVQGISGLLKNCIQLEEFQLVSCSLRP